MVISLTGFMGVGKSTIAAALAKHLLCKIIDLDKEIEKCYSNQTISTIFALYGELKFREIEEKALERVISSNREKVVILSLGGGALISHKNQKLIKENSHCIYLRASKSTLEKRLEYSKKQRPLISEISEISLPKKIEELYKERERGYLQCASTIIDVDNLSINEILYIIIDSL